LPESSSINTITQAITTENDLQLKDNPLALKVLKEGQIDLKDKRIKITSLDVQDSSLLDPAVADQIKQIDLGDVSIVPKNAILLEDLDVYNIPEDKDILIDKNEKTLVAIGRKMEGRQNLEILNDFEQNRSNLQSVHSVGNNIFEEKTFDEFKKENLFFFEQDLLMFNYRELLRKLLGFLPLLILFGNLVGSFLELYTCKRADFLIEEQEMRYLQDLRKKYAMEILTTNPLFDRKRYVNANNS